MQPVSASIREAGSYSSGMPTVPTRAWRRMVAHLRRFGEKGSDKEHEQ